MHGEQQHRHRVGLYIYTNTHLQAVYMYVHTRMLLNKCSVEGVNNTCQADLRLRAAWPTSCEECMFIISHTLTLTHTHTLIIESGYMDLCTLSMGRL